MIVRTVGVCAIAIPFVAAAGCFVAAPQLVWRMRERTRLAEQTPASAPVSARLDLRFGHTNDSSRFRHVTPRHHTE